MLAYFNDPVSRRISPPRTTMMEFNCGWGLLLAPWRFAFRFGEEFFGFNLVAATIDGGNEVIFGEKVDKHGEIFVVHDDD